MRKHVFVKVLLVCLLVGLLAASANAETLKVKVTNKTDALISIAFAKAQTDTGGELDNDPDKSKGWWNVKPGETRTLNPYNMSPFHSVYYYATSKGGKRVWGGKSGDRAFWIHPKDGFDVAGKKISGGKQVYFRDLDYDYDSRTGEYTATLNFTAKK